MGAVTRCLGVLAVASAFALVTSARAVADEPGESDEARVLVLQAISLVVNTPDDMMAIDERIADALEAPKPEGVDLEVVDRAAAALEAGDLPRTRELLQTSIGAGPVVGGEQPQPIRETSGQPGQPAFAVGAETGTAIVLDVYDPRTRLDAGEIVLLMLSLTAIGLGVWLAWRFRPPDTVRRLRQRASESEA